MATGEPSPLPRTNHAPAASATTRLNPRQSPASSVATAWAPSAAFGCAAANSGSSPRLRLPAIGPRLPGRFRTAAATPRRPTAIQVPPAERSRPPTRPGYSGHQGPGGSQVRSMRSSRLAARVTGQGCPGRIRMTTVHTGTEDGAATGEQQCGQPCSTGMHCRPFGARRPLQRLGRRHDGRTGRRHGLGAQCGRELWLTGTGRRNGRERSGRGRRGAFASPVHRQQRQAGGLFCQPAVQHSLVVRTDAGRSIHRRRSGQDAPAGTSSSGAHVGVIRLDPPGIRSICGGLRGETLIGNDHPVRAVPSDYPPNTRSNTPSTARRCSAGSIAWSSSSGGTRSATAGSASRFSRKLRPPTVPSRVQVSIAQRWTIR